MDFSSTPVDTKIAYQIALANAVKLIDATASQVDLSSTREALVEISDKITAALKDEQFEIDKLKEI
jgi:hypothetical protein